MPPGTVEVALGQQVGVQHMLSCLARLVPLVWDLHWLKMGLGTEGSPRGRGYMLYIFAAYVKEAWNNLAYSFDLDDCKRCLYILTATSFV